MPINKIKRAFMLISLCTVANAFAEDITPPDPLNTVSLMTRVLEKTFQNTHYRVIGACLWVNGFRVKTTPSIEQYLPDLIVTVSNQPGANPWKEVGLLYENAAAIKSYQALFQYAFGSPFDIGNGSNQLSPQHLNDERTRIVHVIGSPAGLYRLPKITHKPETTFGKPYYSSLADAISDRTEQGEILYMATHPNLLFGHDIGTFTNHWGQEIPRLMRVTQPWRYRASVVTAMHAADIVTNKKSMHVAQPTTNSCGPHCVATNVIYDPKHEHVLWQEIYPNNRMIEPGNASDFGEADDRKGHGNYVFVIWRKYRGCVKQSGKFIWGFPDVGQPQKR